VDESVIVDHLGELRELVSQDGAELELVAVDGAQRSVSLQLVLDGVECLDCVMPRDYLEQLSLDILRRAVPELERVSIADPREAHS
jgi:hypothetical protein